MDFLARQWPNGDALDDDAVFKALWPDYWQSDHLSAILRAVVYYDYYLTQIIDSRLVNPGELSVSKQRFDQKIKLARALGAIGPGLAKSLRISADIRNSMAHTLGRQLEHEDVQKLCSSLRGRSLILFACITGGGSKSPQRFRHALMAIYLTLKETAEGEQGDYPWYMPERAEPLMKDERSKDE